MELGRRFRGSSYTGTKGVQRIFEDDSGSVAFTVALGLDTVATRWTLLSTLDASLATCYIPSAMSDPGRFHNPDLLRQPVLVRFRAFRGLVVLAVSAAAGLALVDDSAKNSLPLFSDWVGGDCVGRGSSSRGAGPVVVPADAIASESLT